MFISLSVLPIILLGALSMGIAEDKNPSAAVYPDIYNVVYLPDAALTIDGVLNEPAWKNAIPLDDFVFPWEKRPVPKTIFQALMNNEFFYFAFTVKDSDVVIDQDSSDTMAVTKGDRVEMFFSPSNPLKKYYCFEIDPSSRILDYSAIYHRQFDYAWTFPGLTAKASLTSNGYIVEGAIPLKTLDDLLGKSPLKGDTLWAGIYRAEFSHKNGTIEEHWLSWINPKTKEADFHIPATFGGLLKAKKK